MITSALFVVVGYYLARSGDDSINGVFGEILTAIGLGMVLGGTTAFVTIGIWRAVT